MSATHLGAESEASSQAHKNIPDISPKNPTKAGSADSAPIKDSPTFNIESKAHTPLRLQVRDINDSDGGGQARGDANRRPQFAAEPLLRLELEDLLKFEEPPENHNSVAETEEETSERVERAKENLGRLESEIIEALFPAHGTPEPLDEIAKRLGMTVKEVREVSDNALRGLRGTNSARRRLSTVWN
jgi:hypothetical protein